MDQVKYFKGCLPQIVPGSLLNNLSHTRHKVNICHIAQGFPCSNYFIASKTNLAWYRKINIEKYKVR